MRLQTSAQATTTTSDDPQRPCARADWCESSTVTFDENNNPHRQPALGYRPFCDRDRARIDQHLGDLPGYYVKLALDLGNPSASGQQIRVPFGPRLPIRCDIDTLMCTIEEVLISWHERVADVAQLSFPSTALSRKRRPGFAVNQAALIVAAHLDALLALQAQPMNRTMSLPALRLLKDGGKWDHLLDGQVSVHRDADFAEVTVDLDGAAAGVEILTLHYLARSVLGETRPQPELLAGVPCRREECDKLALRRAELPSNPDIDASWSECTACGDLMNETEYRDWTRRYAAWAMRVVPRLENLPNAEASDAFWAARNDKRETVAA